MAFFDLADPAFSVISDEVHRAREECWYAHTSYGLAVLRHDQASRLIRHPQLRQGSSAWPAHHGITSGLFADWWADWVLNKEGADHQRLRRLLNPAFSRRLVAAMEPRFGQLAQELVDSFAGRGQCEFMTDFAEPYAARVITAMLGIPEEEWPVIARDSAVVGLAMGVRIGQHLEQIEAALGRLYAYADAQIADRRAAPRDDCVTSLVRAHTEDDRLSEAELRDTLVLLMFGGFDTTRNQLGLAMQVFIDHPGQWRLLGRHPGLAPAAVEEVMRVSPTTTWVTREALADFTFDGLAIEAGTTIHLLCESAGTDPRAGEETAFDITAASRPPHLAFGGGIHYCLGHLVARCDMSVALAVLAQRLREPRVSGTAVWLPCSGNTGPARLPLVFSAGTLSPVLPGQPALVAPEHVPDEGGGGEQCEADDAPGRDPADVTSDGCNAGAGTQARPWLRPRQAWAGQAVDDEQEDGADDRERHGRAQEILGPAGPRPENLLGPVQFIQVADGQQSRARLPPLPPPGAGRPSA